jgi:hypothetical protein
MAALCLDACLQTLRSLWCRRMLRLQGDFRRCLHKGSPQALQAVVTLLAQVPEETVVQKQPSLQHSRLIVFSFGQHGGCNRTYDRTM